MTTSRANEASEPIGRPSEAPLAAHHRHLERVFEALVAEAQERDAESLHPEWKAFERELERHLALEEAEFLPDFAREHPEEAREIRSDHAAIRSALVQMGIDLELHALRADAVAAFVEGLKAHARREEHLLYPWAARSLPARVWSAVRAGLASAAGRLIP
jgi:hemerythrin-like domain-containing protein